MSLSHLQPFPFLLTRTLYFKVRGRLALHHTCVNILRWVIRLIDAYRDHDR